jgi:8-oxo-dGTP diphosphatase
MIDRVRVSVAAVRDVVSRMVPGDAVEAEHRLDTLAWLDATDDVFRRVKPATPPRHLVSYVVPMDPTDGSVLLVDHVNAGLWLPPGGHVEPDEHPADTARREAHEELGIDATPADPAFLTVTRTVGIDAGHTDVSLWYVISCRRDQPIVPDAHEFREVRWWSPVDLAAVDPTRLDPHFPRFLTKVGSRRTDWSRPRVEE